MIHLVFPRGALDDERKIDAIFMLEDLLQEILGKTGTGKLDGDEFCEDTVTFFIYGQNANDLYNIISPIITSIKFSKGSYLVKQREGKEKKIFLA